jgi:hypothetical protein
VVIRQWPAPIRVDQVLEVAQQPATHQHGGDLAAHESRRARHVQRQSTTPIALINGGLDRVRRLLTGRYSEVSVPADLPPVEVDAAAIERVIANLVHNALKYAPAHSHIRLAAVALPLSGDRTAPGRDANRSAQNGACAYPARPNRRAGHRTYHRPRFGPQS